MWRRAIKEHFNCQCVYCGETYELNELTLDHVIPRFRNSVVNELHNLVTTEFLQRIKSGEASTQDLKAACDWLAKNDISGVAYEGNPLDKLASVMPKVDPEMVQRRLYGKV